MNSPTLSVIMPVYNVEKYVASAINSVLQQTYENFELIIIDDASADNTYEIVCSFQDNRIIKIKNIVNQGIAKSLNKGLALARAKYVARMDGDDICKVDRFEKQLRFMDYHYNLGICGSHMELINEKGDIIKQQQKEIGYENIKIGLFFGHTSMAHPSIIMRKSLLDKYFVRYDPAFQFAEDYDLYCRCCSFMVLDNYPESLIQYRIHPTSVSQQFHQQQIIDAKTVLYLHLRRLRLPFTLADFRLHTTLTSDKTLSQSTEKQELIQWLDYLYQWNKVQQVFSINYFNMRCHTYRKKLQGE